MKSGNLNFLEPSGPLQACNGTDLPYFIYLGYVLYHMSSSDTEDFEVAPVFCEIVHTCHSVYVVVCKFCSKHLSV
jgi:hypothetical protein